MRDPWMPVAMLLCVLLSVWLGVVGPLPGGIAEWIKTWQTLLGATIASVAAGIAVRNTTRTLQGAATLEERRRGRKQASVRALLPLALSEIHSYAGASAKRLDCLLKSFKGRNLPHGTANATDHIESLPTTSIELLAELIEFTDKGDLRLLEVTIAWIQIQDARVRSLIEGNNNPAMSRTISRTEIESLIVDAASIVAGATAYFRYARGETDDLPPLILWDDVRSALRTIQFWEHPYPTIHAIVTAREPYSMGPFHRLS